MSWLDWSRCISALTNRGFCFIYLNLVFFRQFDWLKRSFSLLLFVPDLGFVLRRAGQALHNADYTNCCLVLGGVGVSPTDNTCGALPKKCQSSSAPN